MIKSSSSSSPKGSTSGRERILGERDTDVSVEFVLMLPLRVGARFTGP